MGPAGLLNEFTFSICLLFETRHFLKSCIIFLFVFIYLNAIILGALHMYIVYDTYCVNKIRFNFYFSFFPFLFLFFYPSFSPTTFSNFPLFFFSVFTSEICTNGYIALAYIAPPPPSLPHTSTLRRFLESDLSPKYSSLGSQVKKYP